MGDGMRDVSWHHGMGVMAFIMAWVTCPSTTFSTMLWVIVGVVAWAMARVTFLHLARGHHVRGHGTHHGIGGGKHHVS